MFGKQKYIINNKQGSELLKTPQGFTDTVDNGLNPIYNSSQSAPAHPLFLNHMLF
jgi:hypothetical protein